MTRDRTTQIRRNLQALHDIAVTHFPVVTARVAAYLDEPDPYR